MVTEPEVEPEANNCCWRALARQQPIVHNSEKKTKFVGCKIGDMRDRLRFLYPGIPRVFVNARGNIDRFRAIAEYSRPDLLEIKDTINEVKYRCV